MGAKVPMGRVYGAIIKTYGETISRFEAEGRHALTITFRAFEQALYAEGLVSDKRTVRTKWDIAVAQGVLREIKPLLSAEMDLYELRYRAVDYKTAETVRTHTLLTPVKEEF